MHKIKKTLEFPGFHIQEHDHGYQSFDHNKNPLVLSGTLGECKYWSEQILKGEWTSDARPVNDGVVGGKL